jgi:hypothetical protein
MPATPNNSIKLKRLHVFGFYPVELLDEAYAAIGVDEAI